MTYTGIVSLELPYDFRTCEAQKLFLMVLGRYCYRFGIKFREVAVSAHF